LIIRLIPELIQINHPNYQLIHRNLKVKGGINKELQVLILICFSCYKMKKWKQFVMKVEIIFSIIKWEEIIEDNKITFLYKANQSKSNHGNKFE